MITAHVDFSRGLAKLRRIPPITGQTMQVVISKAAREFISSGGKTPGMVQVTPPASKGVVGKKAELQGRGAINRDVNLIYATAAAAFESIKQHDAELAALFWMHIQEGDFDRAESVLQFASDGKLRSARVVASATAAIHANLKRGKRRIAPGQRFVQVVKSAKSIEQIKRGLYARVGLLAAGFNPAAQRLGISLPRWIARHGNSFGRVTVTANPSMFYITIANSARHASANDMARRMRYVADYRLRAIERQMPFLVRKIAREARLRDAA